MFMTILLIVLAAVIALLVVFIAMRPAEFRVTRKATIPAPAATVFEHVNDLHKWKAWSPWAKLDPAAKETFEGPASGTGAIFRWAGNKEVGVGSMTITESRPSDLIRIKLEFLKPFKATSNVEFSFKPEGDRAVVTWSMAGTNNFISKAVGLFMNCEKMVGGQFEQGLGQMKSVVVRSMIES